MTLSAVTTFKIEIKIVFFPRIESELAILGNETIDFVTGNKDGWCTRSNWWTYFSLLARRDLSQSVNISGWEHAFHVPFNAAVSCNPTSLLGERDQDQTSKAMPPIQPLTPQVVSVGMTAYVHRHLAASAEGAWNPAGRTDSNWASRHYTHVHCSLDRCVIDAARRVRGTGSM